ncbi:hypothetical protein ACFY7C_31755 [Streptomyces sp. NPDC012769]|uniref:hypothetical protein n=1 Tax=Streptomyces sp. NPDC012769 TaxID=3364848 RepID=UPI0036A31E3E
MELASKWDIGFDLAHLVWGLIRIAFMALPEWIRYPVLILGGAFVLWVIGTRVRDWWRERGATPPDAAETPADT